MRRDAVRAVLRPRAATVVAALAGFSAASQLLDAVSAVDRLGAPFAVWQHAVSTPPLECMEPALVCMGRGEWMPVALVVDLVLWYVVAAGVLWAVRQRAVGTRVRTAAWAAAGLVLSSHLVNMVVTDTVSVGAPLAVPLRLSCAAPLFGAGRCGLSPLLGMVFVAVDVAVWLVAAAVGLHVARQLDADEVRGGAAAG